MGIAGHFCFRQDIWVCMFVREVRDLSESYPGIGMVYNDVDPNSRSGIQDSLILRQLTTTHFDKYYNLDIRM